MSKLLSFKQVLSLIATVGDKRTVIVEGENGIGKTALFHALKHNPKFANHIAVDPIDCTQLSDGSVWMPDLDRENGVSRELPNERFGVSKNNQLGMNNATPILCFLDEVAKAPQFIKNVLAPIIYERRVGNYHMPEGSVVFCATNLAVEGLGDSIQAHLRNRLVFVKMRKPTTDEWVSWAIDAGVHPSVIAWVKTEGRVMDSFLDYEDGGKHAGKELDKDNGYIFNPRGTAQAYATPRSLVAASDILHACDASGGVDDETIEVALQGTIGFPAAAGLASFIRFGRDVVSIERIIKDPLTAPVSDNPMAQLIVVLKIISVVDKRSDAEKCLEYVSRMSSEMQSVFINSVVTSGRAGLYATVSGFGSMLDKHHNFL